MSIPVTAAEGQEVAKEEEAAPVPAPMSRIEEGEEAGAWRSLPIRAR